MKKLKLNLGCGFDKRDGYLNIDVDPRVKPDKVHDLSRPLPFPDNSVTEIILQDIVEHFTKEDATKLLQACARVLEKGGELKIRVPNVRAIVDTFSNTEDILMLFVYGDTTVSGVWGAHKYGYTKKIMTDLLYSEGLQVIMAKEVGTNWEFVAKKLSKKPHLEVQLEPNIADHSNQIVEVLMKHHAPPYSYYVVSTLMQFLSAFQHKEHIVWYLTKPFSPLLAKLVIRKLLSRVDYIIVDDDGMEKFTKEVLRFSHLRTIRWEK